MTINQISRRNRRDQNYSFRQGNTFYSRYCRGATNIWLLFLIFGNRPNTDYHEIKLHILLKNLSILIANY